MTRVAVKTKPVTTNKARPSKRGITENDVRVIVHDILTELEIDKAHQQVKDVAQAAAKQAVEETLMSIGVDTKNPLQAQASFAALRNLVTVFSDQDFQADLQHLRAWRISVSQVRSKGMLTVLGAALTGAFFLVLLGFKVWVVK